MICTLASENYTFGPFEKEIQKLQPLACEIYRLFIRLIVNTNSGGRSLEWEICLMRYLWYDYDLSRLKILPLNMMPVTHLRWRFHCPNFIEYGCTVQ
jgi:hypothetical protein